MQSLVIALALIAVTPSTSADLCATSIPGHSFTAYTTLPRSDWYQLDVQSELPAACDGVDVTLYTQETAVYVTCEGVGARVVRGRVIGEAACTGTMP